MYSFPDIYLHIKTLFDDTYYLNNKMHINLKQIKTNLIKNQGQIIL